MFCSVRSPDPLHLHRSHPAAGTLSATDLARKLEELQATMAQGPSDNTATTEVCELLQTCQDCRQLPWLVHRLLQASARQPTAYYF